MLSLKKIFFLVLLFNPNFLWAWGKRGHQIVGELSAILASTEPGAEFLKNQSLELGVYNNIPDFVWKRPETYSLERNQHFIDLEVYKEKFKDEKSLTGAFLLDRKSFEHQHQDIKENAGRVFWRVREFSDKLLKITNELKNLKPNVDRKSRQDLQSKWLVVAGTMGHYWADLSQPLHVTHNHDGQLTGQKGLHAYFEEEMVTLLYPEVVPKILEKAKAKWPEFKKQNEKKSILELLMALSESSSKEIQTLLSMDKVKSRNSSLAEAKRYETLIVDRLAEGVLYFAEVLRRHTGWKFDDQKFYFFAGEPEYIGIN